MTSINYITNTRVKRKIYGIIGAISTLIIPFLLMLSNEDNHLQTDQSLCPFKMISGFPCPGCGITKSLVYFFQGDLLKSLSYHILGPFVVLFSLFSIVLLTCEIAIRKEYLNKYFYNKKLAYGLGVFLTIYHVCRLIYFVQNNSIDSILKESIWK